jgi:hypothetical protein
MIYVMDYQYYNIFVLLIIEILIKIDFLLFYYFYIMNTTETIIDYNYFYNYYNHRFIYSNEEKINDNLNLIIKDMERLDEIKEEMLTTQEYLDKSNMLYKRYNDLKAKLGNI